MNKDKGKRGEFRAFLNRFDIKLKDTALWVIVGVVIVAFAWIVFHAEDTENAIPTYATETETKVLRLLQEIEGVGAASVIVYEKEGDIENVVVVCEGANDLLVKMNVREAVSAAFGVEQKSVKIYLKKE